MNWTQEQNRWIADTGHVVLRSVVMTAGGGVPHFFAFGPQRTKEQLERISKVQYRIGEQVPTPREALGSFLSEQAAMRACEIHAGRTAA